MENLKRLKLAAFALSIVTVLTANGIAINATNMADLKTKQGQIQSETRKAKDLLNDTTAQKNTVMEEVLRLDVSLDEAEEELAFITTELDKTTTRLAEAETELSEAQIDREEQYQSLKKRMRYMYMNGEIGYLDVLFESADVSDFMNRFEYIDRIIVHDNNLVEELAATEKLIGERVQEIDIKKKEQEILANNQAAKNHALEEAREQKNQVAIQLSADEQSFLQQIDDLEASSKEVEALIRAAEAKAAAARKAASNQQSAPAAQTVTYNGQLGWPVPGRSNISSGYEYRTSPKREFHTGIDIPAPTGHDIVAAEAGTVISSKYMNGYGYTVIIDHGGGLSSLYGHNSKLIVSVGETVSRGQVIAKAGSTGYSTGPHCHFEVRENGKHVNPWNYLQ